MRSVLKALLIIIFSSKILSAQTATEELSAIVAKNYFYEIINLKYPVEYESLKMRLISSFNKNGTTIFRVYTTEEGKGFIIVSSQLNIVPVLGYSTEDIYLSDQKLPPNFEEWINNYALQTEIIIKKNNSTVHPGWERYSKKPTIQNNSNIKDVAPLLSSTWNQGCGYNNLCPIDASGPCGRVWAGCVATAMAQVMKFHQHPISGEGSHSYTHYTYGEQTADFESAIYDWVNMPNNSGNAEISELIYHCGVSVNMNYSPSGSGAYSSNAANAMIEYFKYSPNLLLTNKGNYTEYNWVKLIKDEIDNGRPLYYHGYGSGGHAFNIDGYQGNEYFHLNWGWGGSYNGYYYLNDLTPGGSNFTSGQGAIVGACDRDIFPGLNCSSPIILTSGIPYNGTTTTSVNTVNQYGNNYYHSTGKETVHQITTTYPGRIRATLSNLNDSLLDVFILFDSNQDSVLTYGDTTVYADDTEPGTYYIVVDGRYGFEGNYTLTVTGPDENPDLIIENQTLAPSIIESGQIAYVDLIIKNIGNAPALNSKTNIYYSIDPYFDISDQFINQIDIPTLNTNESFHIGQNIMLPEGLTEGQKYIIFVVDADHEINETDEIFNTAYASFTVPEAGIMDCNTSVNLSSGNWYYGNTNSEGNDLIDGYSFWSGYTAKETIHSITAEYNGVAEIFFSEKIPGQLHVFPLPSCNENTCSTSISIWNPNDTLIVETMQVFSGVTYYFAVDGEENIEGEYAIKINMPSECPEPHIYTWAELDDCENVGGISLNTSWLFNQIQWYKDDVEIPGATTAYLWATESGNYKLRVNDYNCSVFSETVTIRLSPEPEQADLSAQGDTIFCQGNSVNLDLITNTGYSIEWLRNNTILSGQSGIELIVNQTGEYRAKVSNYGCSILSNPVHVIVKPVTADFGEYAQVNSKDLTFWLSCDINDNIDLTGNSIGYYFTGWDYPEDRNGIWNKSSWFNGQWNYTRIDSSYEHPDIFTISIWFKTISTKGGVLISFGDIQSGQSTISDRMVYMDDSGHLLFGLINGSPKALITSQTYNDNYWHHLAATLSPDGAKLYIDGELKASDPTITFGGNYTGWWRLGYEYIEPSFPNVPSNNYYTGCMDEVKWFKRSLSDQEILRLYEEEQLFTGETNINSFCDNGSTEVILSHTESFIDYQLRNNIDDSPIGSPIEGNDETISLPTGFISETRTFNIYATNTINSCALELTQFFTVNIYELPEASLSGGANLCEGDSTLLTFNLSGTAPWQIEYTDGVNFYTKATDDNPYQIYVSNEGTYQITAISDANCIGTNLSGFATVGLYDLPYVELGPDVSITAAESVTLDAGAGFENYLWSDNSTSQTLTLYGSMLGTGNYEYWVTVEDTNTCQNSDTINIEVTAFVDIDNYKTDNIMLGPNPATGKITIYNANEMNIEVLTLDGAIILSTHLNEKIQTINIPDIETGFYLVKVFDKSHIISKLIYIHKNN